MPPVALKVCLLTLTSLEFPFTNLIVLDASFPSILMIIFYIRSMYTAYQHHLTRIDQDLIMWKPLNLVESVFCVSISMQNICVCSIVPVTVRGCGLPPSSVATWRRAAWWLLVCPRLLQLIYNNHRLRLGIGEEAGEQTAAWRTPDTTAGNEGLWKFYNFSCLRIY